MPKSDGPHAVAKVWLWRVTPMVLKSICGLRPMALKLNRDKKKKKIGW